MDGKITITFEAPDPDTLWKQLVGFAGAGTGMQSPGEMRGAPEGPTPTSGGSAAAADTTAEEPATEVEQTEEKPKAKPGRKPKPKPKTIADVRTALQAVCEAHGMEKAEEVLAEFGAENASGLKDELYGDFIAACEKACESSD